jgi:hypothetical protein
MITDASINAEASPNLAQQASGLVNVARPGCDEIAGEDDEIRLKPVDLTDKLPHPRRIRSIIVLKIADMNQTEFIQRAEVFPDRDRCFSNAERVSVEESAQRYVHKPTGNQREREGGEPLLAAGRASSGPSEKDLPAMHDQKIRDELPHKKHADPERIKEKKIAQRPPGENARHSYRRSQQRG